VLIHRVPKGPPSSWLQKRSRPRFFFVCFVLCGVLIPPSPIPKGHHLFLYFCICFMDPAAKCIFPFVGEQARPPPLSFFSSLLIFSQLLFIFSFFFLLIKVFLKAFFFNQRSPRFGCLFYACHCHYAPNLCLNTLSYHLQMSQPYCTLFGPFVTLVWHLSLVTCFPHYNIWWNNLYG